jgi:CheY-like chemotaxis protein
LMACLMLSFPESAHRSAWEAATKILLIDDDAAVLEVMGLMLSSESHSVTMVSSAAEALALLEGGESVDLVLTDLHMPDIDGWQLMRAIRARWPGIRVGIHSGSFGQVPDACEPPDLVFNKPVHLSDLREGIERLQ